MIFSKLTFAIATSLAVFNLVGAAPPSTHNIKNSCNTGTTYCCNEYYESQSTEGQVLTWLLHLDVPANTDFGLACSPITIVGASGNSCSQQPVCCTGNNYRGLVVVGCSPIDTNL